jgi:hypothetical protein
MLIGLSTLIAILFFGGVSETFLIDKLDKGVKKYVVEKERKKEITADLKKATKYIKAFDKEMNNQFKLFKEMNAAKHTTREDMQDFFDQLMKDRRAFQDSVIDDRLRISAKLKPDEWDSIMAFSSTSVSKVKTKAEKKAAKGKITEPFEKTYAVIDKDIADQEKKQNIKDAMTTFIDAQKRTVAKLHSMNTMDNDVLINQKASRDEFIALSESLNVLREKAFENLIEFHFTVVGQTTDEEWANVIKSFNKELAITSH